MLRAGRGKNTEGTEEGKEEEEITLRLGRGKRRRRERRDSQRRGGAGYG
jgi:hypothetical protein